MPHMNILGVLLSHNMDNEDILKLETVFSENSMGKSPKWISCKMAEVTGPLFYVVKQRAGRRIGMWI